MALDSPQRDPITPDQTNLNCNIPIDNEHHQLTNFIIVDKLFYLLFKYNQKINLNNYLKKSGCKKLFQKLSIRENHFLRSFYYDHIILCT